MDSGFEAVWRRVTAMQTTDDEQTRLRRWIKDETAAERIYALQHRYSADRRVRETLEEILRAKRQLIRQLRAFFFLRTGERLALNLPETRPVPLLTVLRERYEEEIKLAESYRKAASTVRPDTAALCKQASEASERNARLLRRLLERLL